MKKFMMFFAGVCLLVMSAVSFTSCGGDDDSKSSGTVLTGTTWEGSLVIKDGGNYVSTSMQISFAETTYSGYYIESILLDTKKVSINGSYSMSSDNKTAYLSAAKGQTVCKISADGKTMSLSNTESNTTAELTKK